MTPISSATPLYRSVVQLTSREWLDALVGCDVLVRGLTGGASGESKNRYLVRGLTGGASGEAENRYLVRGLTGGASGESENRYLV